MRTLILLRIGVFMFTAVALAAAQPAAPVDVESVGPKIGARVPELSGTDQFGRAHTLQSVMGEQGAMLVFFRSADW